MICLAVHRNNDLLCIAGINNASLLSAIVAGGAAGEDPASFHVAGLQELDGGRSAHVYWIHETPLSVGDCLRFELVQYDEPTVPLETKATDSPEYAQEQRELEELEESSVGSEHPATCEWPALEFRLKLRSEVEVSARLVDGEEHIMSSLTWDKWRPERCRVYVRSFTGDTRSGELIATDWLRGVLQVGDTFEIAVSA
jgi:hypothetical protein